ncbi:MAG: AbrB/MazE/SpoVT family DNA-binding domain-containing protein [Desulfovibrionaceae bacterium]|nr:AbrB/MazE/SpoVT family DNA-binding domain-containing protein [Desulfovibrionaceae bacterium]
MQPPVPTTRLSSKGQIVLPSSIRHARQWKAGTEFQVQETAEGILLKLRQQQEESRIEDVAGCLKTKRRVSLAQMDAAIAKEVKARHARGRY